MSYYVWPCKHSHLSQNRISPIIGLSSNYLVIMRVCNGSFGEDCCYSYKVPALLHYKSNKLPHKATHLKEFLPSKSVTGCMVLVY